MKVKKKKYFYWDLTCWAYLLTGDEVPISSWKAFLGFTALCRKPLSHQIFNKRHKYPHVACNPRSSGLLWEFAGSLLLCCFGLVRFEEMGSPRARDLTRSIEKDMGSTSDFLFSEPSLEHMYHCWET